MIITYARMVGDRECENEYINHFLEFLKDKIDDSYHFIIARINNKQEILEFEKTIIEGKKNILLMKSDEFGIIPPFLDKLFLVFRFYNNKKLYDNKKIFALPCGYASNFDYDYNRSFYDSKNNKIELTKRQNDIFFSGQMTTHNRQMMAYNVEKIKNNFKCVLNYTAGFARGFALDEYYTKMLDSKICLVPDGAVVPESFRYFEAFEINSIVITTYPIKNDNYNHWYYYKSPAIFLDDWSQLTKELVDNLLTEESLMYNFKKSKEYFNNYISPKAISEYILDKIIKKI